MKEIHAFPEHHSTEYGYAAYQHWKVECHLGKEQKETVRQATILEKSGGDRPDHPSISRTGMTPIQSFPSRRESFPKTCASTASCGGPLLDLHHQTNRRPILTRTPSPSYPDSYRHILLEFKTIPTTTDQPNGGGRRR